MAMKYSLQHYYGDIVRYLFLSAGVLMLIGLPIFQDYINLPVIISVCAIAILGIAAGLTNPQQMMSATANFVVAIAGFIIFAYNSVVAYGNEIADDKFLLSNVVLGVLFLFALYFSMKTLRARMLDQNNQPTN